jgi:hypothetical protein
MSIKISKSELFGGGTIFESSTADTVAGAIKEMGAKPNLRYANLSCANLRCANLRCAIVSDANLSYAYLRYADLSYAYLRYANLYDADLSCANLSCADLSCANLSYANLSDANLSDANLSDALLSWQSHDCIAEILRQSAGGDTQKRMVAGLVLVSRDWCWDKFLSLEIGEPLRDWALTTLSGWAWEGDDTAPELLTKWMQERGISRPIRPSEQAETETGTPAEGEATKLRVEGAK